MLLMSLPKLKPSLYTSCMHGLDDLGWTHGFSFTSYGVRVGVRSDEEEILNSLMLRIPYRSELSSMHLVDRMFSVVPIRKPNSTSVLYNLYCDHELYGKQLEFSQLLDRFDSFSTLTVAVLSDNYLFMHAGVVEWRGRGILLPGKSFAGKSTLVMEFLKHGAKYYSDEFAVIDAEGFVLPYRKPISLRISDNSTQSTTISPDANSQAHQKKLSVELIAFCQYGVDSVWQPKCLSQGLGMISLLQYTHSAQRAPERALTMLNRVVENVTIIESERGEATIVAPLLLGYAGKEKYNEVN